MEQLAWYEEPLALRSQKLRQWFQLMLSEKAFEYDPAAASFLKLEPGAHVHRQLETLKDLMLAAEHDQTLLPMVEACRFDIPFEDADRYLPCILTLACARTSSASDKEKIGGLIDDLLRTQQADGAFVLDDERSWGAKARDWVSAGQAVTALVHAHERLEEGLRLGPRLRPNADLLGAARRALAHYMKLWEDRDIPVDCDPAFVCSFSEACVVLFRTSDDWRFREQARRFATGLQNRLINSGFYENLAFHPHRASAAGVAWALRSLVDAMLLVKSDVARNAGGELVEDTRTAPVRIQLRAYSKEALACVEFLLRLQVIERSGEHHDEEYAPGPELGGFGVSLSDRRQQLDINAQVLLATTLFRSLVAHRSVQPPPRLHFGGLQTSTS